MKYPFLLLPFVLLAFFSCKTTKTTTGNNQNTSGQVTGNNSGNTGETNDPGTGDPNQDQSLSGDAIILFNFSELPFSDVAKLKENFQIDKIDKTNGTATLKETALRDNFNSFLFEYLLSDDILAYPDYAQDARVRGSYFEFVIQQLPDYVQGPAKIRTVTGLRSEKSRLFSYLVFRLRRDAQHISNLFEQYSFILYDLLPESLYSSSGIRTYIKGLIQSYDYIQTIPDNRNILSGIGQVINGPARDVYKGQPGGISVVYEPIIDPALRMQHEHTLPSGIKENGNLLWMHSFWVRRFAEGNEGIVYGILKKIDAHYGG